MRGTLTIGSFDVCYVATEVATDRKGLRKWSVSAEYQGRTLVCPHYDGPKRAFDALLWLDILVLDLLQYRAGAPECAPVARLLERWLGNELDSFISALDQEVSG